MDPIVHFEIPVDDPNRAYEFYQKSFGWTVNAMPQMEYALVQTTPTADNGFPQEPGRINGGMLKRGTPWNHPILVVSVGDIDSAMDAVRKNGGKIVHDKHRVGDIGISAYFQDTEGNVLCLWQPLKH